MKPTRILAGLLAGAATLGSLGIAAPSGSQVIGRELISESISHSKIGTDPVRRMAVYLPAGYDQEPGRFPVIYFLPNPFGSYRAYFDERGAQGLFDKAISKGVIGRFILVCVDMNTPIGCSWYVNSPATGNWEDFAIKELVPYIDANFRTIPSRDSRGIVGDFMGGYGAMRLGMEHPDVFGAVYALHPVGTGSGVQPLVMRPNWDTLAKATSLEDSRKDGFTQIFTAIFQAHLPNPENPPLYVDLPEHKLGDQMVVDSKLMARLRNNFFIESLVPEYADNLKSLRGLKFDWSRADQNQDHIYANQALTHKLNEFGVVHEAEEYNGNWGEANWGEAGRVYSEVLPFFSRHLVFDGS